MDKKASTPKRVQTRDRRSRSRPRVELPPPAKSSQPAKQTAPPKPKEDRGRPKTAQNDPDVLTTPFYIGPGELGKKDLVNRFVITHNRVSSAEELDAGTAKTGSVLRLYWTVPKALKGADETPRVDTRGELSKLLSFKAVMKNLTAQPVTIYSSTPLQHPSRPGVIANRIGVSNAKIVQPGKLHTVTFKFDSVPRGLELVEIEEKNEGGLNSYLWALLDFFVVAPTISAMGEAQNAKGQVLQVEMHPTYKVGTAMVGGAITVARPLACLYAADNFAAALAISARTPTPMVKRVIHPKPNGEETMVGLARMLNAQGVDTHVEFKLCVSEGEAVGEDYRNPTYEDEQHTLQIQGLSFVSKHGATHSEFKYHPTRHAWMLCRHGAFADFLEDCISPPRQGALVASVSRNAPAVAYQRYQQAVARTPPQEWMCSALDVETQSNARAFDAKIEELSGYTQSF